MSIEEKRLLNKIRFLNTTEGITRADYYEFIDLLFAVKRHYLPVDEEKFSPDGNLLIEMIHNTNGLSAMAIFTDKTLLKRMFPSRRMLILGDLRDFLFDTIADNPDITIVINPNNEDKTTVMDLKAKVFVDWKNRTQK